MAGRGRHMKLVTSNSELPDKLAKILKINDENKPKNKKVVTISSDVKNGDAKPEEVVNKYRYIAKYSYKANSDSPGGFKELSLKRGEEVVVISKHKEQPHWCEVQNKNQEEGFVPMSYLYKNEVTSLPWLTAQEIKEDNETKNKTFNFVPYKSAYNKVSTTATLTEPDESAENYFCEICNRKFNGPVPFRAHLRSKAHKEEVELAKEYGRL